MKLNVRGSKIEVTTAIKEYIETKVARLDRYFENPEEIEAHVIIKAKDRNQTIEVTIPTAKFTLRAEETHEDLYASIDLVLDKLERQIRKNKTKLNKYKNEEVNLTFNFDYEDEEEYEDVKIVKRKNLESKPMDEEEAILQMELLNHDFFVFKNVDEDCVSVLYKRKDGCYGIMNVK